ncbi:MAG: N-acetylmuramoyl-L-alanine amidase [Bacteroidales bacterium]|nr:N-acetylmuramoyl-L-alanine amidase [Bacteroidales bacterium]
MKRLVLFFGICCLFLLASDYAFSQDKLNVNKIIIDAGHGGHDPGTLGKFSKEKDIALTIALKFGNYVEENFPDVTVIYTRKTDKFIELYKRAEIANKNNADLFISIHCNGVKSSSPFGTETFVMGLHKSAANLEVARKENASILMEDNYSEQYDGYDPNSPEAYIIFSMYQNAFLDQSLNIASKIQAQFRERVGRKDRGVKQDGFLVLYKTTMPGVLVETGFLSNLEEEKFLMSDLGQTYIASAIYRAFRDYKNEYESQKTASTLHISTDKDDKDPSKAIADTISNNVKGIVFKVQFFSSENDIPINSSCFKNLSGVQKYFRDGQYKFTVGEEYSVSEASKLKKQLRKKGFKDAFVIAFNNGERIKVNEAAKLLKK